jgi:hypothetical protein
MIFERFIFVPVIIFFITSLVLVLYREWRICLAALFIQYLGIFWITAQVWPIGLAAVKLMAGWMAGAVLTTSQIYSEEHNEVLSFGAGIFRILSAGVIWLFVLSVAPTIQGYIPVKSEILTGGILLIGMGLLQLGMTNRPFQVVLGLLTTFSGFEIIYAGIEVSVLVAGLLAAVNLGLAAAGTYLMTYPEAGGSV